MTVIGVDPSLSATGVAIDDHQTFTVATNAGDLDRLIKIHDTVLQAAATPGVQLAVIEDLPTHAKGAGLTGMAQGVIRLALRRVHVPMLTVPAATLKVFATGKGNATKADMRMALYQRTGRDIRDDNQCDAIFLRELGLHLLGQPTFDLPKTHTRALDKLTLPEGIPA